MAKVSWSFRSHLADDVARDGIEQELLETSSFARSNRGQPLPGTYPPNAETLARYRQWRDKHAAPDDELPGVRPARAPGPDGR